MLKIFVFTVTTFSLISILKAGCVVQGVCGGQRGSFCHSKSAQLIKISKKTADYCSKFSEGEDGCCSDAQIDGLKLGLADAAYWFGDNSKCFHLMRDLFCHMYCSENQDHFIHNVTADSSASIKKMIVDVKDSDARSLFDACKHKKFFFVRLVNKVCLKSPCDYKEFLRSLGAPKSQGGRAPFHIHFNMV